MKAKFKEQQKVFLQGNVWIVDEVLTKFQVYQLTGEQEALSADDNFFYVIKGEAEEKDTTHLVGELCLESVQ